MRMIPKEHEVRRVITLATLLSQGVSRVMLI